MSLLERVRTIVNSYVFSIFQSQKQKSDPLDFASKSVRMKTVNALIRVDLGSQGPELACGWAFKLGRGGAFVRM